MLLDAHLKQTAKGVQTAVELTKDDDNSKPRSSNLRLQILIPERRIDVRQCDCTWDHGEKRIGLDCLKHSLVNGYVHIAIAVVVVLTRWGVADFLLLYFVITLTLALQGVVVVVGRCTIAIGSHSDKASHDEERRGWTLPQECYSTNHTRLRIITQESLLRHTHTSFLLRRVASTESSFVDSCCEERRAKSRCHCPWFLISLALVSWFQIPVPATTARRGALVPTTRLQHTSTTFTHYGTFGRHNEQSGGVALQALSQRSGNNNQQTTSRLGLVSLRRRYLRVVMSMMDISVDGSAKLGVNGWVSLPKLLPVGCILVVNVDTSRSSATRAIGGECLSSNSDLEIMSVYLFEDRQHNNAITVTSNWENERANEE